MGARPQRLLWASTGTKDPKASDTLYVDALASPLTVNTMPEGTLKAFADHGKLGAPLPDDGGDCEEVLVRVRAGRRRRRGARGPAPGRGREVVREVVERAPGRDRGEDGPGREGRLSRAEDAPMATPPLRLRKSWAALALHHAQVKDLHLRQLFADPTRAAASG